MKTPKEILLQRHEAVEPKLDAVRQKRAVGAGPAQPRAIMAWIYFFHTLASGWIERGLDGRSFIEP